MERWLQESPKEMPFHGIAEVVVVKLQRASEIFSHSDGRSSTSNGSLGYLEPSTDSHKAR